MVLDLRQAAYDYGSGLVGFGIPSAYHVASAISGQDRRELGYALGIEASVLATQYGILKILNWYQGPKYAMSFVNLRQGLGAVRSLAIRAIVTNPLTYPIAYVLAGGTLGLGDYRNRMAEHKSHYSPMTQRKMR